MMSSFRLQYTAATISLAIAATSKTATFLLLRYFIDTVLDQGNYSLGGDLNRSLFIIALGFLSLATFEGSFSYFSGRLAAFTAEGITRRLRNYLFDHIQRLDFSYHDKTPTGELIERCTSDVDALRRFFSEQAIGVGRIVLLFVINFAAILNLNTKLAFISIIVVPVIILTSIWFFKRVTKAYEAYQEQEAILSTTLQENLAGVRVVKAFARQDYEINKFNIENWEKYIRGRKLLSMHSLFWPVSDIACSFQTLTGFFIAATMAINGQITVGTYLAYAGLVGWLIWPMRNLGRLIVQTSTGLVSYGRVMEIIKQKREPLTEGSFSPDKPLLGELVFDKVGFAYEENPPVLADVSFTCKPGQVVALLGSTGSGKTTLVNLLPRFYEYTSGSIKLDGVELKDYPREYLRGQVGIVEQEPFLFSRSIRENITYGVGRDVPEVEVKNAATSAAIHDVIVSFPNDYDTLVGEKGVTLSGGQKQRVTLARTILKDSHLLILDDSTSSVDTETEACIRESLMGLTPKRTTFIIAHRIQSVMNADLILVMDKGRIIQKGTHEELLAQDGMYRKIYDLQTRIDEELEMEISQSI
ncbi:MAG: ABC transporter [Chloroflexi bacterium RBG_16_47_49]|nr:MAG: ABC transporter [Chloroflexi bacterium RBG_16_47_49]